MAVLLPHAALAQHHLEIPPGATRFASCTSRTLTTTRFKAAAETQLRPAHHETRTDFLAAAVAAEKPSLIVFTGDISDEFIGF